ncbi:MAG: hypothetical protein ACFB15_02605 [Cyclobacteriaceae bacterium]
MTSSTNYRKIRTFQRMYAINIIGAGIPGFLIVFFPDFAEQHVLWPGQDRAVMAIVGSIWLAIGIASLLGIYRPLRFLGIFVVQLIYKLIWLTSSALPNIVAGNTNPAMWIIIGIFVLLIIEFVLVVRKEDFQVVISEAQ